MSSRPNDDAGFVFEASDNGVVEDPYFADDQPLPDDSDNGESSVQDGMKISFAGVGDAVIGDPNSAKDESDADVSISFGAPVNHREGLRGKLLPQHLHHMKDDELLGSVIRDIISDSLPGGEAIAEKPKRDESDAQQDFDRSLITENKL
jgi:hypothetical protein